MKKLIVPIMILTLSACTQWKKLTNSEKGDEPDAIISGVWNGNIALGTTTVNINMILSQAGSRVTGQGAIDYNGASSNNVTGETDKKSVFLTFRYCTTPFSFNGETVDGNLVLRLVGQTNDPACYNGALDTIVTLHR